MPQTDIYYYDTWVAANGDTYGIPDGFDLWAEPFYSDVATMVYSTGMQRSEARRRVWESQNQPILTRTPDEAISYNETACICEACKAKRYEPNGLRNTRIHSYNYKPVAWTPKSVSGDKFPYYMGVELETSINHSQRHLSNGQAADLRRPKRFWVAKRDGSVDGPEFASHPATLTWWHANEPELVEMFKTLVHAGYTSHNGNRAGMHVNISRNAFSTAEHLWRFLTLITSAPDWSLIMSQRTVYSASQWAQMRDYDIDTARIMFSQPSAYATDKYSVVNAPRRQDRFEFRLPRGTLRIDRFMKNLEWTAAMIGYTRTPDNMVTPQDFMAWCDKFPMVYRNLIGFIREKYSDLTSAAQTRDLIYNSR